MVVFFYFFFLLKTIIYASNNVPNKRGRNQFQMMARAVYFFFLHLFTFFSSSFACFACLSCCFIFLLLHFTFLQQESCGCFDCVICYKASSETFNIREFREFAKMLNPMSKRIWQLKQIATKRSAKNKKKAPKF